MLETVKNWLRIKTDKFDDEIKGLIAACLLDLKNGGVAKTDESDALIRQAVKLFCKAYFGYEPNSERFAKAYEALRISLALSGDYNEVT